MIFATYYGEEDSQMVEKIARSISQNLRKDYISSCIIFSPFDDLHFNKLYNITVVRYRINPTIATMMQYTHALSLNNDLICLGKPDFVVSNFERPKQGMCECIDDAALLYVVPLHFSVNRHIKPWEFDLLKKEDNIYVRN
jgi:hypothetical protein